MGGQAFVVLAVGAAFVLLFWCISIANAFVRLSNLIRESWSDVDVALKRRHDLIPNLVETVKAYAHHEDATLRRVVEARDKAMHEIGPVAAHARDEQELGQSIRELIATVEAYPELKASQHFLALQEELANTEDRIAAARRFYNSNVREFNTRLETFPSSLFAGGRQPAEYFEIDPDERETPVRT
jgi:LemA protein